MQGFFDLDWRSNDMSRSFELELLEARSHLSATLSSRGILYVVGTPHSDAITFELERRHPGVLDVTINGGMARFYTASVRQIFVESGRGKDKIVFDDRYGKIPGQPEHRNNKKHDENDDFVTDDGSEVIEVVDDSDTTTDSDSSDDSSPPADDSTATTQPTTEPTTDPTTQPSDPSGDDSDSGDDGSPTD
jgi:hypothetical protein